MGQGKRSFKKLKIYFCFGFNEIIWYLLEGSIRIKNKFSKGGFFWRQIGIFVEVNFFDVVMFCKGKVNEWRKLSNGEDGSKLYCQRKMILGVVYVRLVLGSFQFIY